MVELKLNTKQQNIQALEDVYSEDKCQQLALNSKEKAFGIIHNVKNFFGKKGDVKVIHSEKRYEPFWHISAESYMEYKRKTNYSFTVKPEVRSITINGKAVQIEGAEPVCHFVGEDYCVEQYKKDITTDAVQSKDKGLAKYINFPSRRIKETEELMGENKVVIPAQVKASYLIRELFKELIKPIHADTVIEERVEITGLTLIFRPIYAFEIQNEITKQIGVLEVDAIFGDVQKGKVFKRELKELISEDVLFEVGAEIAGTIIPGAGAGAAIAREIKKRKEAKKAVQMMESSKKAMAEKHKGKGSAKTRISLK
ncbi:MAG: hypothetical protein KJ574_05080 [Nanoarchaeota archaeon]|nr:hypothetical protein [Nanoarchaeota archaeon]